jgi:dTMP kinase
MLISFDGLDSSGKATQARLLTEHLTAKGIQSAKFRSPDYKTISGKELKLRLQNKGGDWQHTPWREKMGYFAANRAEHRDEVISLLEKNAVVVYDRYVPSSVAFMVSEANVAESSRQDIQQAVQDLEYGKNGMPKEDVSIFFDIPPKVAIDLLKGRKDNHGDEDEYTDYLSVQEALHREYVRMSEESPEHMVHIFCMEGERLRTIEEIALLVRRALSTKFPEAHYFL